MVRLKSAPRKRSSTTSPTVISLLTMMDNKLNAARRTSNRMRRSVESGKRTAKKRVKSARRSARNKARWMHDKVKYDYLGYAPYITVKVP